MASSRKPLRNIQLSAVQKQELCVGTPIKVPASPLLQHLGYGTGVNVYFLERSPRPTGQARSPWAIKRVSQRIQSLDTVKSRLFNDRIVKEAEILRQLNHPNIIGFRALTKGNEGNIDVLALECCSRSLDSILEIRLDHGDQALAVKEIKKVLFDVARALDYLHTEAMLLHGDIKSHNILVKGDFEICKLCDFGVSLPLNKSGKIDFQETPHLQYVGTNLWCSPEVIAEVDVIDSKADIFSFGLVIFEMITLRPPFLENTTDDNMHTKDEDSSIINISDTTDEDSNITNVSDIILGGRPALPEAFNLKDEYNTVMELYYLCTNEEPAYRPTAKIIWSAMKEDTSECIDEN